MVYTDLGIAYIDAEPVAFPDVTELADTDHDVEPDAHRVADVSAIPERNSHRVDFADAFRFSNPITNTIPYSFSHAVPHADKNTDAFPDRHRWSHADHRRRDPYPDPYSNEHAHP
jgi:hypothetical protein